MASRERIEPFKGRVLVAEDDPSVRRVILGQLEDAGYQVVEAEDGEEALQAIGSMERSSAINAIICDIRMPTVDGIAVVRYVREKYPAIPIIVLTGLFDLPLTEGLLDRGVSEFLTKPIDQGVLVRALQHAIGDRG